MTTSKAQLKAVDRYNKSKTTTLCIRLNNETDKDIIDYLNSLHYGGETKQGLIKSLIRKQIDEDLKAYNKYLDD